MLLDLFDIDGFYIKTINPELINLQDEIDSYAKVIDLHIYNDKKRISMPSLSLESGERLFNAVERYLREHNVLTFKKEQMKVEHIEIVQDRKYLNCFVYLVKVELTKAQVKKYKE